MQVETTAVSATAADDDDRPLSLYDELTMAVFAPMLMREMHSRGCMIVYDVVVTVHVSWSMPLL